MNEVNISGALFRDMLVTGAALLERNKAHIDSLNVFPVPDGDTGTNMMMTVQSAIKEIKSANCTSVTCVADALSLGALKGARGNSGVILSQIFRGFSQALKGAEDMDAAMLCEAIQMGTKAAYKAVMKPKEGTMLTVSRMISEATELAVQEGANAYELIDIIVEAGERALLQTPDLLPVLKEAGVVDSGGKGLLTIYRGFKMAIDGEDIGDSDTFDALKEAPAGDVLSLQEVFDIRYPYCTEFFITNLADEFDETVSIAKLREKLSGIGDSLVLAYDSGMIKVHVHTPSPGKVLQFALHFGEIDKIKIDNMREQNRQLHAERKQNERPFAIISVANGDGISKIMKDLAVDALIQGGQTMNPSIEDISNAIFRVNAKTVYVLPNNSNIILAAQQAAESSDCNVRVIPTKTIPQGISAAMAFHPDLSQEENEKRMNEAIKQVVSGAVTYAVRDTTLNGEKIQKDDIIGLMDNKISTVNGSPHETAIKLLHMMIEKNGEPDCIVTIFYGQEMDADKANKIVETLQEKYPEVEFIVENGGQPIYYYFFSVE